MLKIDLQPRIYTNEGLAKAFATVDIKGKRFCLPHGNLANPQLSGFFRESGGTVEEWILYETWPETDDWNGARKRFVREGAHWITFTSSSTVENWHALRLQPADDAPQPRALSLGPVTSATLLRLKYDLAAEAAESTIDSLIAALIGLV
jgi:uroporphyrinogen III methyltransferase/synthase